MKFTIIGYGAAGTFAALSLRQSLIKSGRKINEDHIIIIERNRQGLRKVKISGGGRCNVTHHQFDVREFSKNYPRGQKELIGPFHNFQAQDTVAWFAKRGVELKVEEDGRMFPVTNSSQTIIDCFEKQLEKANVEILNQKKVKNLIKKDDAFFELTFEGEENLQADAVMLATGSDPTGYTLAKGLGHTVTDLAPSLFTFKIKDPLLEGLMGTSFNNATIHLKGLKKKWQQTGPLLITHWGLSGPCVLKLSAWAARELKEVNYHFDLCVNFLSLGLPEYHHLIESHSKAYAHKRCLNAPLKGLTKKFWSSFINQLTRAHSKLENKTWSELSQKEKNALAQSLYNYPLKNRGQSRFKEEFVECGGVSTKEINFKSMESKLVSGLFFGGELVDIDGITGGFNFQNAWTTGFIAGENMAKKV